MLHRCFRIHIRALCTMLLLACAATTSLQAQRQEWIKGFGGPGSEYGRFVEQTTDGGFVVGGTKSATEASTTELFWVARFDADGNNLWEKTYGKPNTTHTIFTFNTASDGGFMIGGFTGQQFSGTESALMYRLDSMGNVMWEFDVNYKLSDHWHALIERRTGGYYFGGHTDSKDDRNGDMWLVRLDADRNVIWEKTYDRGTPEHAHAAVETSDGGVFLLGHTAEAGLEKFWILKADSNGTAEWDRVLSSGPAAGDAPYDLFETAEGNFALIGYNYGTPNNNSAQGWLTVVDPQGNTVIDKQFGTFGAATLTWSGRQTRDGGFILSGYTTERTIGAVDMYVVKTDAQGEVEWEGRYGGFDLDYGFDVVEANEGYIGVGITRSAPIATGGSDDLMLVKIGSGFALPEAVTLATPIDGAKTFTPGGPLGWRSAFNASRYHLQVATDEAFTTIIVDDSTITGVSSRPNIFERGTRYWWRVRGGSTGGWGPFSSVWSFETVAPTSSADAATGALATAVSVTPNPTDADASIAIALDRGGIVTSELFDVRGTRVLAVDHGTLDAGSHRVALDARELGAGVYALRLVRDGAVVATTRFTVIR